MLELIIICGIFWLGYQVGVHLTVWSLRDVLIEAAKREGFKIDKDNNLIEPEDDKPNVYKLVVEKVKDTLYLYDHKDEFVCQASTVEELATLAKQHKNIKYAAVLYGDDTFMFVDGDVKTKL
jgi:peroxiredoxin family protein